MQAKKKSQPVKAVSKATKNTEQVQAKKDKNAKRDRKLGRIKLGIETGTIINFNDIFDIMSSTTFGRLVGNQYESWNGKLENPLKFTFQDAMNLSNKTGISYDLACQFIRDVVKANEAAKEKKPPTAKGNAQN